MSAKTTSWILFLLLGFVSCKTKSSVSNISTASIFSDSLYLFHDYKGPVIDTFSWDLLTRYSAVDSNTEKKILTNFYPFDSSAWSIAHMNYLIKLHPVGDIQPIIVIIRADDYGAMVLVNFDRNGNVIDRFELTGGLCAGPDEADSFLAFCPDKHAFIFDSSHLALYKLTSKYYLFPQFSVDSLKPGEVNATIYDSIPVVDSLSFKLDIKKNGKIVSTQLDSVRIDKHKNPVLKP